VTRPTPPLELTGVGLAYDGPSRVEALRAVDLSIARGEFVAVVGPSGAGKSSLLHVLGLLTTPTSGDVHLDGARVADGDDVELTRRRGHGIGFVFQAFHLLEARSAWENVALPLRYQGIDAATARQRAESALDEVGLGHRATALARTLSGGERQRVAIARAVVTDPAVLLCDEPTGNLDSTNSANVLRLLSELHDRGRTIVVITHDESIAAAIPRVVRILDGVITAEKGPGPSDTPTGASPRADGRSTGGMRLLDLLDEALAGLLYRGWRTTLTCMGTVLGVATMVATLGLASTASTQVSRQFDRLAATTVTATSLDKRAYEPAQLDRAEGLNGVEGLAYLHPVDGARLDQSPTSPEAVATSSLPVVSATPGSWQTIRPSLRWGRVFDGALDGRRVAVLGSAAARQAGVYGPIGSQSILISGQPYLVIGVFDDVERRTDLLLSVVIPQRTSVQDFGDQRPVKETELVVATAVGAGRQVASELPYALSPGDTTALDVVPPPDPRRLREDVDTDLTGLFVVLAAVTLLVGTVGIANTSLVAVMERIAEIGLRRALGAQRRSILAQFLTESALIGAVGGLIGTLLGLITILGISVARQWTPVVPREVLLLAPFGGAIIGVVAGYFPARRAAHTDPTAALRN
jgi:macrolide transport system ATP-binding/permease protein